MARPVPVLDHEKRLVSDLWVDQPDALDGVDRRLSAGTITEAEADQLRRFVDEGYLITNCELDASFTDALADDVDRIWRERPVDLAASAKSDALCSLRDIDQEARQVGYRIADLHSHSQAALRLYLHPRLFRFVELIFGERALALQSLHFEWGSEQGLHRDPMFVPTRPVSHLAAAWVALEDIGPDAGPFLYVPGSHRMPWFEFEPDSVRFSTKTDEKRAAWIAHRDRMLAEMGLEVKAFTCRRGEALIFHGGLLHGGARVHDEHLTRRSFAIHYSTAAHYRSRWAHMNVHVGGKRRRLDRRSGRRVTLAGHSGLANPLQGTVPSGPAALATRLGMSISNRARRTPGAGTVGRAIRRFGQLAR